MRTWLHDGSRWAQWPARGDIVTVHDIDHYLERVETARPLPKRRTKKAQQGTA